MSNNVDPDPTSIEYDIYSKDRHIKVTGLTLINRVTYLL